MNIITKLLEHGIVLNKEALETLVVPLTVRDNLREDFLDQAKIFFYTKRARSMRDYNFIETDMQDIKIIKYVRTRNFFSDPWCFGFVKIRSEEGDRWEGVYVGKHGQLFDKLKKIVRNEEKNIHRLSGRIEFPRPITKTDIYKHSNLEELVEKIYDRLEDRTEWDELGGISYLQDYISNLSYVVRDRVIYNKEPMENVAITKRGKFIDLTFNTGLFDKYLNFVFIEMTLMKKSITLLNEPYLLVDKFTIVTPTKKLNEVTRMPPIKLCSNNEMVFPDGEIELGDFSHVNHIFKDRLDRLPKTVGELDDELLYYSLRDSITHTNNKLKVSPNYIVPYFNIKWGTVSYLVPLYVRHIDNTKPVCAVVLGRTRNDSWSPVTILPLNLARSNARLLGDVTADWLIERGGKKVENSLC